MLIHSMHIGVMGNAVNDGTIDQAIGEARQAAGDGFHSYWVPQIFGHDALTVLAIVGRLAFAGGNALQKMRGSRLRDSTTEVASSLRWAFDRSLAIGKHHRVAIRLGSNKWWVERCERRLPLRRDTDPEEEREREEKAEEERLKRAAEALAHVEAPIEESAKRDREEAAAAEEDQPPPPWCNACRPSISSPTTTRSRSCSSSRRKLCRNNR